MRTAVARLIATEILLKPAVRLLDATKKAKEAMSVIAGVSTQEAETIINGLLDLVAAITKEVDAREDAGEEVSEKDFERIGLEKLKEMGWL